MAQTKLSELRARRALSAARLDTSAPVVPIESVTNEVWACGDVVIRLNRRLHNRLQREAEISALLPPEVRLPAHHRRRPWPRQRLGGAQAHPRRAARPGVAVPRQGRAPPRRRAVRRHAQGPARQQGDRRTSPTPPTRPSSCSRAPSPPSRSWTGIDRLEQLPHIDRGVIDELRRFIQASRLGARPVRGHDPHPRRPALPERAVGRAHVTALLDLEFARAAPPDLDLDVFLRFCSYPSLFVPVGREDEARREDYADVAGWLMEDYTELFSHPRLVDRLRLYSIAFDVRNVLAPAAQRAADRPHHAPPVPAAHADGAQRVVPEPHHHGVTRLSSTPAAPG